MSGSQGWGIGDEVWGVEGRWEGGGGGWEVGVGFAKLELWGISVTKFTWIPK